MADPPVFYFDLGSPYAYLTAERLDAAFPDGVSWQPVLLGAIFSLTGRSSWSLGDPERRRGGMAEIERRAESYGLPPLCWPDPWPANTLTAMRAATYARRLGREREFALQAFRDAFARGVDLTLPESVFAAGERAGLRVEELREAVAEPQIKGELREASDAAHERGVIGVPTVAVSGELFWGDDRLQGALECLRSGAGG